jgi:hypothetical protein
MANTDQRLSADRELERLAWLLALWLAHEGWADLLALHIKYFEIPLPFRDEVAAMLVRTSAPPRRKGLRARLSPLQAHRVRAEYERRQTTAAVARDNLGRCYNVSPATISDIVGQRKTYAPKQIEKALDDRLRAVLDARLYALSATIPDRVIARATAGQPDYATIVRGELAAAGAACETLLAAYDESCRRFALLRRS